MLLQTITIEEFYFLFLKIIITYNEEIIEIKWLS